MGFVETSREWYRNRYWAGWAISGIGLSLAGLSLWYLIVVKALHLGAIDDGGVLGFALRLIEVALLAGFSLVLIYGGYWIAASQFHRERAWWAGLWTMVGLAGVVAIVGLVTAFRIQQGQQLSEPTIIQEMLLAAGGGALAGLLIGISTVRETIESEHAREQRDTLLFVNELLRHNVLNGMTVILGNNEVLRNHVDEDGERYLDTNDERAKSIVELIQNVRRLMRSVSGETTLGAVELEPVLSREIEKVHDAYPTATFETDLPDDVQVRADELLDAVFENLLANAVDHHHDDEPTVAVDAAVEDSTVEVHIADDGPGIPNEAKERYFGPGEQDEGSVGQGLGLYLVETLVERYGGSVRIEDNDPRGSVFVVELQRVD